MMMNLPCLKGSCPNFLRPIYHTLCASQAPRRSHAHGENRCRLQLLFFVWLLLTCIHLSWYWFTQWTLYHYCFLLVFCRCSPFRTPSFTGFCSRTLSSLRCLPSATRQSSGLCCFFYFLCYQCFLCWYWALDILQQFFRIISCPCLQDGVNHP